MAKDIQIIKIINTSERMGGRKGKMRLIDADYLKNILNSGGSESVNINISKSMSLGDIVDTVIMAYRKCLFAELEKVPTAYDLDKVVEQLEELREMVPVNRLLDDIIKDKPKELGQLMAYRKAIEIVKSGLKV